MSNTKNETDGKKDYITITGRPVSEVTNYIKTYILPKLNNPNLSRREKDQIIEDSMADLYINR